MQEKVSAFHMPFYLLLITLNLKTHVFGHLDADAEKQSCLTNNLCVFSSVLPSQL